MWVFVIFSFVFCLIVVICFIVILFYIYWFDDDGEEDEFVFVILMVDVYDNKGYILEVDDEIMFLLG